MLQSLGSFISAMKWERGMPVWGAARLQLRTEIYLVLTMKSSLELQNIWYEIWEEMHILWSRLQTLRTRLLCIMMSLDGYKRRNISSWCLRYCGKEIEDGGKDNLVWIFYTTEFQSNKAHWNGLTMDQEYRITTRSLDGINEIMENPSSSKSWDVMDLWLTRKSVQVGQKAGHCLMTVPESFMNRFLLICHEFSTSKRQNYHSMAGQGCEVLLFLPL